MTIEEQIDLDAELRRMKAIREETYKIIVPLGFVPDTSEWMRVSRYAAKYGLAEDTVSDWIDKGIIPADCVTVFLKFGDIRLVKDQPYQ